MIVPAYNEEETVELFYDAFAKVENQMDVEPELIFVDDGSKDKTLVEIKNFKNYMRKSTTLVSHGTLVRKRRCTPAYKKRAEN